jgi:hypothetical protein
MGAKIPNDEPDLPASLSYLWELHKTLRFAVVPMNEGLSLIPREPLNYREISAYLFESGLTLNTDEIGVIMSIDSIFEKFR